MNKIEVKVEAKVKAKVKFETDIRKQRKFN